MIHRAFDKHPVKYPVNLPVAVALAAAILGGPGLTGSALAAEDGKLELGYLECELTRDTGNVLVSEQSYSCLFEPADGDRPAEVYTATSDKVGIDLSKTETETVRWAVLAAGYPEQFGALAGDYGGVSADVSLGVGAGAKVLVGGFEDTITLQPLSVSTQEGYGLSLAIESLDMTFVGTKS
jgi:hypothetical protein